MIQQKISISIFSDEDEDYCIDCNKSSKTTNFIKRKCLCKSCNRKRHYRAGNVKPQLQEIAYLTGKCKGCNTAAIKVRRDYFSTSTMTCRWCYLKQKYKDNPDKYKQYVKQYRERHPKKVKLSKQRDYQKNYRKRRDSQNNRKRERRKEDLNYRLRENLRKRLWDALNGNSKSASTMELLGCTIQTFRTHLEKSFTDGMSWDNYGYYGWHIDHIIPISSFNLEDPEEQKKACHYTNLQPLWAQDNLRKSNNIVGG